MTTLSILLAAAKAAHVSGALLVAVCMHESGDFTVTLNKKDGGSPSYGICQVKEGTAKMFGFKGPAQKLMDPKTNAKYAAKYLAYQVNRYGADEWVKLVAAYNAGTYVESKKKKGCPRNLKYIKKVQQKLEEALQPRLSCGKV